jgi:hypothetical protein
MALLLETEPRPSPAPGAAKETSGATPRHAKDHGSARARPRPLPVSRYGLRAKLIARLKEQGGDERI